MAGGERTVNGKRAVTVKQKMKRWLLALFGIALVYAAYVGISLMLLPSVGDLANLTRAGRVLLTHLLMHNDPSATVASVCRTFDGPVRLVTPGDRFTLAS